MIFKCNTGMRDRLILNALNISVDQGFGTLECNFTNEEGVGDCPDSFAFDGNRQFAWNVQSQSFGEVIV